MDDIRMQIKEKPFEIFAISETWLNTSIADSEIEIPAWLYIHLHEKTGEMEAEVEVHWGLFVMVFRINIVNGHEYCKPGNMLG